MFQEHFTVILIQTQNQKKNKSKKYIGGIGLIKGIHSDSTNDWPFLEEFNKIKNKIPTLSLLPIIIKGF